MTVQKLKHELEELKEALKVKKETPWDYKCLMLQYRDESTRRSIKQKIYNVSGKFYEEQGSIVLHYADYFSLSREAREFLVLSNEQKAATVEKEFPYKHITEEEAEDLRIQLKERINGMGERLRYDNTTA
jgi:hypothetical protein